MKSLETIVSIATISNSAALSKTGSFSKISSVSTGVACGLSLSKKVKCELFLQEKKLLYKKSESTTAFYISDDF